MINWENLIFNALWILGAALALAVFSFSSFRASQNHLGLVSALRLKASQAWLSAAGFLFCLGLAGTSASLPGRIAWLLLALLFVVQLVFILRTAL